jgi:hemoglobin
MKQDIQNKQDIQLLVDTFYGRVLEDEVIKDFFSDLDFAKHKPKMVHFWSFVLLDEDGYTTNVFDKHVHMPLKGDHFDRWMQLFDTTVDELFEGEKATTAKFRAKTIGWTFKEKFKRRDEAGMQ